MSKNLISVSTLYVDNPINVLFFYSFFQVQDHHTGVTLVHGQYRDSVYYWPMSILLQCFTLVFSSSVQSLFSTISIWYSHLGHLSLNIFLKLPSVLNISFPEEHLCSFSSNSCNINKIHKLPFAKSSITSSSPLDINFFFLMFGPHPSHLLMVLTTMLSLLTIIQSISDFTRYVENRMFIQP